MNFIVLDIDSYRCINVAVMESEETALIDYYTGDGWDYCQSVSGIINGEKVVYVKFSKGTN